MDGKNAKDGGINRRNLLLSAGAIGAGVAAATLSQASPALANGSFFGDNCIIYPAGLFTGSQQANRFPARSRPRLTSINGNAAGHHDVTGLKVADDLAGVLWLKRDSSAANIDIVDLTGEFSITADGRITNTTTDTSGDRLLVSYSTSPGTQLAGLPFPPGETSKGTLPLLAPAAWESVKVSILGLSGEQTVSHEGTVRLGWQSNGAGAATAHT